MNITVTMYISIQSLKIVMAEPLKNKLPWVILSLFYTCIYRYNKVKDGSESMLSPLPTGKWYIQEVSYDSVLCSF